MRADQSLGPHLQGLLGEWLYFLPPYVNVSQADDDCSGRGRMLLWDPGGTVDLA